jgi:KipI family sensor histidine kinase inhibitor
MDVVIAGENSFIIYFADQASPTISARITLTAQAVTEKLGPALIDLIPSYASLLVIYDTDRVDHLWIQQQLQDAIQQQEIVTTNTPVIVELPVYYSLESGPDLEQVAARSNLSIETVIELHQQGYYQVYAIGFAPGFAYLGEVDGRIATPRLATPRLKVPQGAVAIADRQTAVYPSVSPGGWNLIGLCPLRLFDPKANPPMPFRVGDQVGFKAVDRVEFLRLGGAIPDNLFNQPGDVA